MIEFTLSRVTMLACGIILMSAVVLPVMHGYDSMEDDGMTSLADGVSLMLDSFWDSKADAVCIRGWELLPDPSCSLTIDGPYVTLHKDGREYTSLIGHRSGDRAVISYNDVFEVTRDGDLLRVVPQ